MRLGRTEKANTPSPWKNNTSVKPGARMPFQGDPRGNTQGSIRCHPSGSRLFSVAQLARARARSRNARDTVRARGGYFAGWANVPRELN